MLDRIRYVAKSVIGLARGMSSFSRTGQFGDGREAAARDYVLAHATPGDPESMLRTIGEFARARTLLPNVGDEKGLLLDAAIRKAQPTLLLELGTYIGYSAVRTARLLTGDARLLSLELNPVNAALARDIIAHAGLADRVTVLDGTLGDGGSTRHKLTTDHALTPGALDFVFFDHLKSAYLPDLHTILEAGWLHPGSVVVADNVKIPGAPDYRRFMRDHEGTSWRTVEHNTHVEYQSFLKDLVLESEYLG
ncbi:class I SAM-dependent methyltransferase [Nocardia sp. NPDC051832]|uniref:O-methyltransferase n=1 Tax=Nocardia sp. NPDC051832 TaxID=3155673 RepID=UPI00343C0B1B